MRSVFRHLQNEMIPKSQNNFNNLKHAFINCGFVLCVLYYFTDRGSLLNIMMMSKKYIMLIKYYVKQGPNNVIPCNCIRFWVLCYFKDYGNQGYVKPRPTVISIK